MRIGVWPPRSPRSCWSTSSSSRRTTRSPWTSRDSVIALVSTSLSRVTVSLAVDLAARQRAAAARGASRPSCWRRSAPSRRRRSRCRGVLEPGRGTCSAWTTRRARRRAAATADGRWRRSGRPSAARRALSVPAGGDGSRSSSRGRELFAEDRGCSPAWPPRPPAPWRRERLAAAGRPGRASSPRSTGCAPRCSPPSGHDLRTPLAGIKAAVSQPAPARRRRWTPDDARRAARHHRGVRRPAGRPGRQPARREPPAGRRAVRRRSPPVRARRGRRRARCCTGGPRSRSTIDVPDDLPLVLADAGLLERVVANLVDNALRHSPPAAGRASSAEPATTGLQLRVVDHGPGRRRPATGSGCSPRSSGSTTAPAPAGRPRPGHRPRLHRGDGRHAHRRRHPGGGLTMTVTLPSRADDPRSSSSTTTAQLAARAARSTCSARGYEVDTAGDGAAGARRGRRAARPTSSSSTSACPTWTASRSSRACAAGPRAPIIVLSARHDQARQGRRARRRRRRLRHQAVRHGRAARPGPGRAAPRAPPADDGARRRAPRPSPSTWRRRRGHDRGGRGAAHPDRVAPARGPGPPPRPARHPAAAAAARCGGPAYETETNYLRVYMAQLRRKLEPDPARPRHLITEPGLGYRFEP